MADSSAYLRLVIDGTDYLLPGAASVAIEQRDKLTPEPGAGPIVAWRETRAGRWPAYGLTRAFEFSRPGKWQRAVFLAAAPHPIGVVAEEVQLLGRVEMHIAPFAPLGAPPTPFGHFFNAAWVDGSHVTFVIDPRAVAGFLARRAGTA